MNLQKRLTAGCILTNSICTAGRRPGFFMKSKRPLMTRKYLSMLTGATMACLIAYAVLLCDSVISGLMIGEIAVNAVNLVSPIFSAASFFAMIVSLGVPILYTNALGRFRKEEAERISGAGAASSV